MNMRSPIVGVHLDLKYQIPSQAYLHQWIRQLPAMGINTLLIEYEDKFPFQAHPFLQAAEAFTPQSLRHFLNAARQVGLQVIPLVQTLSHLEYALGHDRLAHLREAPAIHTQLDTSNPQATALVMSLIDEVLTFHQEDSLFHLGADETWHLGRNERTAAVREKHGLLGMWAQHTMQFVDHLRTHGKRAIVWDDIFWKATPQQIKTCGLSRDVILHCWNYSSGNDEKSLGALGRRVQNYHETGHETIGGPCANWGVLVPRHEHCLKNTHGWARTAHTHGMKGVINTAWSCFHVLPHATTLQLAAMGQMMEHPADLPDIPWQEACMSRHFGCDASGFVEASAQLEAFWEVDAGLQRPLTVILFGCMDMILWYGSQEARMAQGQYPHALEDVNLDKLFLQKLGHLRRLNLDRSISRKLQGHLLDLGSAAEFFHELAAVATRNPEAAAYLAFAADLKQVHARILLALLDGQSPSTEWMAQWRELDDAFAVKLLPFVDRPSMERLRQLWWSPLAATFDTGQDVVDDGLRLSTCKDTAVE